VSKEQVIKNKFTLLGFYIELEILKKNTEISTCTALCSCPLKCYKPTGFQNMSNQTIIISYKVIVTSSSFIQNNLDEGQYQAQLSKNVILERDHYWCQVCFLALG